MRIALLEDNADHAAMTAEVLREHGHGCEVFDRGETFLRATLHETFDLMILDWGIPDMSGLQVLDAVRLRQEQVPVLFLTCLDSEQSVVEALTHGADDFLVKTERSAEFLARLKALKRRADGETVLDKPLIVSPYAFHPLSSLVKIHDKPVELTLRQFQLALVLFRNVGRLLSRPYLLESVWGLNAKVQTRTLDIHISQLRTALQLPENGWRISSVYAHGYRLEPLP